MIFDRIDELVELSQEPLPDIWLEDLQAQVHGNSKHPYCRFLYWLSLELRPALAIEIGVEWGVTSAHLCAAASQFGGHVIGIDIQSHPRPTEILPKVFGNYTFLHKNSLEAVPEVKALVERYGRIGLLYQDGSHKYADITREWEEYSPLFAKGAVLVSDDIMPAWYDLSTPRNGKTSIDYWEELPVENKRLYEHVLHARVVQGVALT